MKLCREIGPGFITGAVDNVLSGVPTYLQADSIIWHSVAVSFGLLSFLFLFMIIIQQCIPVSAEGLAKIINVYHARPALRFAVSLLVVVGAIKLFKTGVVFCGFATAVIANSSTIGVKLETITS